MCGLSNYIPAVTVSPGYFSERRALVMGIITSGTEFGEMIWASFLFNTKSSRHLENATGGTI
jgi:hypothetical protein